MTISKGQKRGAKVPASVPHRPKLLEWLKEPRNAVAYVEAVLDEGDSKGLMQALRNVAEAQGGIAAVAERAGLSRETLYRTLSKSGNPQLMSLTRILGATGLRLSVMRAHTHVSRPRISFSTSEQGSLNSTDPADPGKRRHPRATRATPKLKRERTHDEA